MKKEEKRILFICAYGQSRSRFFAEKFMSLGYKAMFAGFDELAEIRVQRGMFNWANEIVLLDEHWNKDTMTDFLVTEAKSLEKTVLEYYIADEQSKFDEFCKRLLEK